MTIKQEKQRQEILIVAHQDFEKGLNIYALFKTNDRAMGEGLVQDTFLKTWSYLVKGGKIDVMRAFLYHILNNLIGMNIASTKQRRSRRRSKRASSQASISLTIFSISWTAREPSS